MSNQIIDFITQYITLSNDEKKWIEESKSILHCKKGDILLRESEYSEKCFFILRGCVRSYYLIDGEEKNTAFFIESETITPVSYITKEPSAYYLSCLENCILSVASPTQSRQLIKKVPKLQDLVFRLNENLIVQKQIMYDDFKNLNAEKRYLKLMEKRPDLTNRVPQYHIASFLGMTPVSLSRLRGRLSKKIN